MMTVQFEIDFRDGAGPADVEITLSGVPEPEAFRRLSDSLTSDPRFRAGLTLLVDLTALDTSDLSDAQVEAVSEPIVERDWQFGPAAVAIIAPDEHTSNSARTYRAHLGGSKSNRHLFGSRADAVAWLEARNR